MTLDRFVKYKNSHDIIQGCPPQVTYNSYFCTVDKVYFTE